ncbi:MAG: phage tail tape measure protein [Flavobacteriaceae bacterium]|jgi:tubulin-specific chaperone A|nr:phage tail tape measure protein [Flavobacteriaceae bacterium]
MANSIVTNAVIKINGVEVTNSFRSIQKEVYRLENGLKKLAPGTEEFQNKAAALKEARAHFERVKQEISSVNGKLIETPVLVESVNDRLQTAKGFWARLGDQVFKFGNIINGIFLSNAISRFFDFAVRGAKKTVDELLKISDAMTDVQKTSGMSLEQVKNLWDQFDEMDTRTSKTDRLKIAEVGGRLGVPIEQMRGFVQEIDKAYVALGDSFEGGLEGVVEQLGKIKGLFETTKEMSYAEAINRVGSALNTLAAQGVASEGNISEFALRVGAMPDAVKPSIDKVLGLGAAFEESGVDARVASSGFVNFITTAGENIGKFAQSMHMGVAETKELINTKPEEFFLKFAAGMKGLDATETTKVLESLSLGSLEVQKAVGAAANRTNEFRASMLTAGVEMEKMTSLNNEFNEKNNNAPAIIEKLKNVWNDFFTSTNMINLFESIIQLLGSITGVSKSAGNGIQEFKDRMAFLWQIMKIVIAGLFGYQAGLAISAKLMGNLTKATILQTVAEKAKAYWYRIINGIALTYHVTLALVTGNTNRARNAMIAYNSAVKANPIGLLISLLTTAVAAIVIYNKEFSKSAKLKKEMAEYEKQSAENAAAEITNLDLTYKKLTDKNVAEAERIKLLTELKAKYPGYFDDLTTESFLVGKAAANYYELRDAIIASARVEAAKEVLKERSTKRLERDAELEKEINKEKRIRDDLQGKQGKTEFERVDSGDGKSVYVEWNYTDLYKASLERLNNLWKERGSNKARDKQEDSFWTKTIADEEIKSKKLQEARETALKKQLEELQKNTPVDDAPKTPNRPAKNETKSELDKAKSEYEKFLKEINALTKSQKEEELKIIEESRNKEQEQEFLRYESEKASLVQHGEEIQREIETANNRIAELEKAAAKSKSEDDKKKYADEIKILEDTNAKRAEAITINNQIITNIEETFSYNLWKINEKWDAKEIERQTELMNQSINFQKQKYEDELASITTLEEAKQLLREKLGKNLTEAEKDAELKKIKTIEDAKNRIIEINELEMLNNQKQYVQSLIAQLKDSLALATGENAEKFKEQLAEFEAVVSSIDAKLKGQSGNEPGKKGKRTQEEKDVDNAKAKDKVDLFGFSLKDWEELGKNLDTVEGKIKAIEMVSQALSNAATMYADLVKAHGERELQHFTAVQNKKKSTLEKQLKAGLITREEYTKQSLLMDAQLANKEAEINYKAARAEKTSKLFSAIGNVAVGVTNALASSPPPMNFVLAGIVAAMGAIQIGTIAAQPLPEKPNYASGGFTGKGFGSADNSGFKPAGIVHEREWVAPKWMLEEPRTARVIEYLESVRQGKTKPLANGGFSSDNPPTSDPRNSTTADANNADYQSVMSEVRDFLRKLYDEGVIAIIGEDAKNAKKMAKMLKDLQQLENKNKH